MYFSEKKSCCSQTRRRISMSGPFLKAIHCASGVGFTRNWPDPLDIHHRYIRSFHNTGIVLSPDHLDLVTCTISHLAAGVCTGVVGQSGHSSDHH